MATATLGGTDWLNRLVRGELSAIETYQQALGKMRDAPEATELQAIEADHRSAVRALKDQVLQSGGTPDDHSGAWGAWAKFVEGTARIFGNTAALEALRQGEQHGIKEYERAMEAEELAAETSKLIRSKLLPQAQSHIAVLDRLIDFQ
ncbi:MAG TPA: DUF2383 domain-containing protein [Gemmataceae bacterium]|jgi:uncharacterized protein (TIGR02284 family)|nr:DUF2383 domain-containing protein [Gemmataceae bacterium]